MTTNTSEKGLETLIMRHMTGVDGLAVTPGVVAEAPAPYGGKLPPMPRHRTGATEIRVSGCLRSVAAGTHVYKQFMENASCKRFVGDMV